MIKKFFYKYIYFHNKNIYYITKFLINIIPFKKVYLFNLITKIFYIGNYCFSFYDVRLYNPNFEDPTFRYCNGGAYGSFYSNYLEKFENDFHFLDTGANIGIYSLIASKNHFCKKIDAFEPNLKIYKILRLNLLNIKNSNVHNYAISNIESEVDFFINPNSSGLSKINKDKSNTKILSKNRNFLKKIFIDDLKFHIKIDVEGHEQLVLEEIMQSISVNRIYSIYIEIDNDKKILEKFQNKLNLFKLIYKNENIKRIDCLFEKKAE